jgi:hypothetical protein
VEYISVIGSGVQGDLKVPSSKAIVQGLESLLAYSSYAVLAGDGAVNGDGKISGNKLLILRSFQISLFYAFTITF